MSHENEKKSSPFKNYNRFFNNNSEEKSEETKENQEVIGTIPATNDEKVDETNVEVNNTTDEEESYKPINRHKPSNSENWANGTVTDCIRVNFRKEPNVNAEVLEVIDVGTDLLFHDVEGNGKWVKAKLANGKQGYIMAEYIVRLEPFVPKL